MTDKMQIKANEHGLIRLFAVDIPPEDPPAFNAQSAIGWPLQNALGAAQLNADFVECFDVSDLEELGLAGYMAQGLGIAEQDIAEARVQIDAIKGPVVIVLSKAFDGIAQDLSPKAPLKWIGTFQEDSPEVQFKPIASAAAKGSLSDTAPPKKTNPHLTLLAAIVALPFLVGVIALIAWLVLR